MIPQVDFLGKQLSRLIVGDNPVNGHTYIPDLVSKDDLLDYYTEERVLALMEQSMSLGCRAWLPLANDFMWRAIYHHRRRHSNDPLEFLFQSYPLIDFEQNLRMVEPLSP